jgi:hypothetical protein
VQAGERVDVVNVGRRSDPANGKAKAAQRLGCKDALP